MRIALSLLTILLASAGPAVAATVSAQPATNSYGDRYSCCVNEEVISLALVAAPGEANDVAVTTRGATTTVTDSGAPLTAGENCRAIDEHTVACGIDDRPLDSRKLVVELGDGDDVLDLGPLGGTVDAGPGDDEVTGGLVLSGGPGDDLLRSGGHHIEATGGDGNDRLIGGPKRDTLSGGPGDDALIGEARDDTFDGGDGRDVMRGGGGFDTVTYAESTDPVSVDLARKGRNGPAAVPDRITSIQGVIGSAHDDVMSGSDAAEALTGGDGNDTIDGRGGDDEIDGGLGADTLDGGDGNDHLVGGNRFVDPGQRPLPGAPDIVRGGAGDDHLNVGDEDSQAFGGAGDDSLRVTVAAGRTGCGTGRDQILAWGEFRTVPRSCERVRFVRSSAPVRARVVRLDGGRLLVPLADEGGSVHGPYLLQVVVEAHGRPIVALPFITKQHHVLSVPGHLGPNVRAVVVRYFGDVEYEDPLPALRLPVVRR